MAETAVKNNYCRRKMQHNNRMSLQYGSLTVSFLQKQTVDRLMRSSVVLPAVFCHDKLKTNNMLQDVAMSLYFRPRKCRAKTIQ
jgi:hypothetical protein